MSDAGPPQGAKAPSGGVPRRRRKRGGTMSDEMLAVFIGSTLRLGMPLLIAATGELVSEKAGVLNMSTKG